MRFSGRNDVRLMAALLCAASLQLAGCAGPLDALGDAPPTSGIPTPVVDEPSTGPGVSEIAVLAGGCFWGVQGVFEHVRGVDRAISGYAGGTAATAHYDMVGSGATGHAESVQITYEPAQITYGELLRIYFSVAHDPTELDRQGPDVGTQYRSAIFPQNETQRHVAETYIAQLDKAGAFASPIVTRIENATGFFPAEAYHQDFLNDHPNYPYIVVNDMPKLDNLKRQYPEAYREQPALVQSAGG